MTVISSLDRLSIDLRLRNYSPRTRHMYLWHVKALGNHFGRAPDDLTIDEVREYLLHAINQRAVSGSWWRQAVASFRFFYGRTVGREDVVPYIPFPRREYRLPVVLSRDEIRRLFLAVDSVKLRTFLMAVYSGGLRTSEAISLATEDLDTRRMVVHVRQGKGRRDRYVPLSTSLLDALRHYWRLHGMSRWLFPGRDGDGPMLPRWIQHCTGVAGRRAGLSKRVTPRALRHSYATHLFEAGTDIRVIQGLLGHASLDSTVIYTHIGPHHLATVRSPLDSLDLSPILPGQLTLQLR